MNHQPTQLALLISLIGMGVAPSAHASLNAGARAGERAIDTIQPLPGVPAVSCDALAAVAMPACSLAAQQVWQPPRRSLDLASTAGVRVLYTAPGDDWAPGETPGEFARLGQWAPREPAEATAQAAETPEPQREKPRKRADTTRKVHVIAQPPAPARMKAQPIARADAAIERLDRIAFVQPALADAGPSHQADRLLDSLAAALTDRPVAPAVEELPPTPEASPTQNVTRLRDAEPAQIERPAITVETQSTKVLRQLGAILAEERDEVGAARPQPAEAIVTTQAEKVIAMLGEIAPAAQQPVEDGPARRLRKLAARAAQAEAKAAAEATAAVAAEVARVGVDLMLPLEMPTFSAPPPPEPALIEPAALPVGAQFATREAANDASPATPLAARPLRRNPFGDRRVAIAESALERVRGGFSIDGLNISFGIERAVYVNGALVTTTSLNISDLGRITAGRGTTVFDAGTIGLVQSGAGNVVSPTMISAGSVGTVVQNTLDGQKIQNVTVINATTNSMGVLKGLNLQSSLRGAVIDSLRR